MDANYVSSHGCVSVWLGHLTSMSDVWLAHYVGLSSPVIQPSNLASLNPSRPETFTRLRSHTSCLIVLTHFSSSAWETDNKPQSNKETFLLAQIGFQLINLSVLDISSKWEVWRALGGPTSDRCLVITNYIIAMENNNYSDCKSSYELLWSLVFLQPSVAWSTSAPLMIIRLLFSINKMA